MQSILKKRWVYHSIIWATIILILFILTLDEVETNGLVSTLGKILLSVVPIITISYISFSLKAFLLDKRRYVLFIISMILLAIFGIVIFTLLEYVGLFTGNPWGQHLVNTLAVMTIAIGLQYLKRGIIGQYQIQELRVKTIENELNALKAQLNPHFLFNTLNNIYGMNQIEPRVGSEMIMELSQLMRYHLDFSKKQHVLLSSEIELLKSYIKLEKLRLSDQCEVRFVHENIDQKASIAPLILLPFVENAFKHGTHSTQASFVHISIKMEGSVFYFEAKNSRFKNRNVIKTEIGLENTRRRLQLIYGKKHVLNIVESKDSFNVKLEINLNHD